jgi:hypothetical protein
MTGPTAAEWKRLIQRVAALEYQVKQFREPVKETRRAAPNKEPKSRREAMDPATRGKLVDIVRGFNGWTIHGACEWSRELAADHKGYSPLRPERIRGMVDRILISVPIRCTIHAVHDFMESTTFDHYLKKIRKPVNLTSREKVGPAIDIDGRKAKK